MAEQEEFSSYIEAEEEGEEIELEDVLAEMKVMFPDTSEEVLLQTLIEHSNVYMFYPFRHASRRCCRILAKAEQEKDKKEIDNCSSSGFEKRANF